MKTMKKLPFFVLALLFLMGCQAKPATDDADSDDAVRAWFAAEEPNYDIVSIDTIKDGEYVLLTTFTPPGVEEGYTMVRAYIVGANGEGYTVKELEDAYDPGSIGFSAEVLNTEDTTVLFGDIGSSVYNPTTDTRRDVTFTEVTVKLADGEEVSASIQNDAPYLILLDAGTEVSDAAFHTKDGEFLYSACYGEPLTGYNGEHSDIYTDADIQAAMDVS